MRNAITFLILLLFGTNAVYGQGKTAWGVSYAPTFMRIDLQKNRQFGQQVYLNAVRPVSNKFSYRFGIGYSELKTETIIENWYFDDDITIRYQHKDLIFAIEPRLAFSDKTNRMYLTIGVAPTVNIGRKVEKRWGNDEPFYPQYNNDYSYKRFDLFISGGLGYEFGLSKNVTLYAQGQLRSNILVEFAYLFRYLAGIRGGAPPGLLTSGIELGVTYHK